MFNRWRWGNEVILDLDGSKIFDNSISDSKIIDIDGSKIQAGTVGTNQIADLSITNSKLADGSVSNTKLADLSVSTEKIQDLAITNTKLADLSVSTSKLQDGSVLLSKLKIISTSVSVASASAGYIYMSLPAHCHIQGFDVYGSVSYTGYLYGDVNTNNRWVFYDTGGHGATIYYSYHSNSRMKIDILVDDTGRIIGYHATDIDLVKAFSVELRDKTGKLITAVKQITIINQDTKELFDKDNLVIEGFRHWKDIENDQAKLKVIKDILRVKGVYTAF